MAGSRPDGADGRIRPRASTTPAGQSGTEPIGISVVFADMTCGFIALAREIR